MSEMGIRRWKVADDVEARAVGMFLMLPYAGRDALSLTAPESRARFAPGSCGRILIIRPTEKKLR